MHFLCYSCQVFLIPLGNSSDINTEIPSAEYGNQQASGCFNLRRTEPLTEWTGWPAVRWYCFYKVLIEQSSIVAQFAFVSNASLREETGTACYFHAHSSRGSCNYVSHVRPQQRAQCWSFDLHKFKPFERALHSQKLPKSIEFCLFTCASHHACMFKTSTVVMYVNVHPI